VRQLLAAHGFLSRGGDELGRWRGAGSFGGAGRDGRELAAARCPATGDQSRRLGRGDSRSEHRVRTRCGDSQPSRDVIEAGIAGDDQQRGAATGPGRVS